jgi:hypothetical protein
MAACSIFRKNEVITPMLFCLTDTHLVRLDAFFPKSDVTSIVDN